MKYKHKKSGRIYDVLNMNIINATNKDDGIIMVLYKGEKKDGSGIAQFVRELNEFHVKFEPYDVHEHEINKKLSYNIERTDIKHFDYCYQYKFKSNQLLEAVDEHFIITHNEFKQKVINSLISEFEIALNAVIFGDPAGRSYVEHFGNAK